MITIPSLNDVTDILDTDMIMVTQQSGQSYKIAGSEINKRGKIIIADGTTITGAPLKAGSSVRVYFTVDLTAANASTTLQLNYNNVNYYVKAPKDGTLIKFVATNLGGSPAVFKYLQKYTTLELLFDGTQFVIIGNPVILSSADYTIYADGLKRVDSVNSDDKNMVTSDAVSKAIGRFKNFSYFSFAGQTQYFEICRFSISSGGVASASFLIGLFQTSVNNISSPINFGCINVSSGANATGFSLNGFLSIPLDSSYMGFRVYKTSTKYILYLYSTYAYTNFTILNMHQQGGVSYSYSFVDSYEGTKIYDSATNTNIKIISQLT